jgi:hypothetical protein
VANDLKNFFKIGRNEEGRLWVSWSTDGLEWSTPYVFAADNKEPIFWVESTEVLIPATLHQLKAD